MAINVPTLKSALDGLQRSIDESIQRAINEAKNAATEAMIQAGRQASLVIENAEHAYAASLELTMDRLDKAATAMFQRMESMVAEVQQATADNLEKLLVQAEEIVAALPFTNVQPRLSSMAPRFVVLTGNDPRVIKIKFIGNFPSSEKDGFEPRLSFHGRVWKVFHRTNKELVFQGDVSQAFIPQSNLVRVVPNGPQTASDPSFLEAFANQSLVQRTGTNGWAFTPFIQNQETAAPALVPIEDPYRYTTGQLTVAWNDGWFRNHRAEFNYDVGLTALPLSPGETIVEYKSTTNELERQPKESPLFTYDGGPYYKEGWVSFYVPIKPDINWQIDTSINPILGVNHIHGVHRERIYSVTPQEIVVLVELYCKHSDKIGVVQFKVYFQEFRQFQQDHLDHETVDLTWGESRVLDPGRGRVVNKVTFTPVGGAPRQEFGQPDPTNLYLKSRDEGNGKWKIWTEIPKDDV